MKKIFAMILCLALLLSSAAMADSTSDILTAFENKNGSGTIETEVTLNVDEAAINEIAAMNGGSTEGMEQIVKPIVAIVNNLKFRTLTEDGKVQLELKLKDTTLATIGYTAVEGGMAMVTDLLPNYIIKADTAKAGGAAVSVQLTEEEKKAVGEAAKAKMDQFEQDIKAKVGEAETGSWTFDGATFTEKKPLNITTKELTVMTLKAVKDLLADPSMKKVVDAMGEQFDTAKLDEAIANAEKKEDSEYPALTWYIYTNAEGNEYHDVIMEKDDGKVAMAFSVIGKKLAFHADIDSNGKGKIEGLVDAEKLTVSLTADIESNGNAMNIAFELAAQEDGSCNGTMALSMSGKQLLGIAFTGKPTDEKLSVSFDEEGKKVVPIEALSDRSSAEGQQLMSALTMSLPGVLQKAMQAMPDEVNALITLFGNSSK